MREAHERQCRCSWQSNDSGPVCAAREDGSSRARCSSTGGRGLVERIESISWRNLIAACAAVCVFAFSLGEIFPLLSLSMESRGVSPRMIGFNTAMAPIGILLAGLFIPRLSHRFGAKSVALTMAFA